MQQLPLPVQLPPVAPIAPRVPMVPRYNNRVTRKNNRAANVSRSNTLKKQFGLNKECPSGYILRKPYYKKFKNTTKQQGYLVQRKGQLVRVKPQKNRVLVKASCVRNTSKFNSNRVNSRGRMIKQLGRKRGELLRFGYSFRLPASLRHEALVRAIQQMGLLNVYHKLDSVAKIFEFKKSEASRIFLEDRDWIADNFEGVQSGGGCGGSCGVIY
jgi:hypothetical protein